MILVIGSIGFTSFRMCEYFSKRQLNFDMGIVRATAQEIVAQLVHADYTGVVRQCATSRVTSTQLRTVIEQYGHTIVSPPPDVQGGLDLVRVFDIRVPTWSVQVPLWTDGEGRSDLTFELTIAVMGGTPSVTLDDLHVL